MLTRRCVGHGWQCRGCSAASFGYQATVSVGLMGWARRCPQNWGRQNWGRQNWGRQNWAGAR